MLDNIGGFLADNYVIFIVISAVLLLALIGFIVTGKKKKKGEVQTADPMAQPTSPENQMPSAPMGGEMPAATQAEPVAPAPNMNVVAPETPVAPATPTELATPVEPLAQPVDASLGQNTVVEPQTVPMEPVAPVNSDEPTLIIEDKSVSQETPVMPTETSDLFATPNAVNTPIEPVMPAEPTAPVTPEEPAPVEPAVSETPVVEGPAPVEPTPAPVAEDPAPETPAQVLEEQPTSIFENQ